MISDCLPNFIIAGCSKSGTTTIADYLASHPEVYFSRIKEPRYFAFPGVKPEFEGPGDEGRFNKTTVWDWGEYKNLFAEAASGNYKAIGEGSPIYCAAHEPAALIKKTLPDVKIVIVIRNPIERVISSYTHNVRDGYENLPLAEALRAEESRKRSNWARHWHYKSLGHVSEFLQTYLNTFDAQNLMFVLYDDFKANNQQVMDDIHGFLGVKAREIAQYRLNAAGMPRSRLLARLASSDNVLNKVAMKLTPPAARKWIRRNLITNSAGRPDVQKQVRVQLLEEFSREIDSLAGLLGRDLSHWKTIDDR